LIIGELSSGSSALCTAQLFVFIVICTRIHPSIIDDSFCVHLGLWTGGGVVAEIVVFVAPAIL
jgi:hypothetical protein